MARQTLHEFIIECFNDKEKAKGQEPLAMVLTHNVGIKPVEVDSVNFAGTAKWDLKILAERFEGKAQNYSQDLAGVQQFTLNVFWPNDNEPKARRIFRVTGALDAGIAGDGCMVH